MKKIELIFLGVIASGILLAQPVGNMFPTLNGETLDGNSITLPNSTKGKFTLIGLAFSGKAEDELRTWFDPAYQKFIAKSGMFDDMYDVNVYFIAMFTGANKALMNASMKRMKKSDNKELYPYVLYYKGQVKTYKEDLNMPARDTPYFFILDKTGKIAYKTSGTFKDRKFDEMDEFLLE